MPEPKIDHTIAVISYTKGDDNGIHSVLIQLVSHQEGWGTAHMHT